MRVSKPEYSDAFCISFVRKGNFLFNVFRRSLDSYNGCVLVTKPGYERTVTHVHTIPDECTIFEFKNRFYAEIKDQYHRQEFFTNNDIPSTLIHMNPQLELLHHEVIQNIFQAPNKLKIDSLVIELLETIMPNIADYKPNRFVDRALKRNHLVTIERAKEYLTKNFMRDMSLMELASYSHVSSFHFSRIFKKFTSYSPHKFLVELRLKNAELYLKNTSLPVSDIGFTSGFNSAENFTMAFRKKYGCSPSSFRTEVQ